MDGRTGGWTDTQTDRKRRITAYRASCSHGLQKHAIDIEQYACFSIIHI